MACRSLSPPKYPSRQLIACRSAIDLFSRILHDYSYKNISGIKVFCPLPKGCWIIKWMRNQIQWRWFFDRRTCPEVFDRQRYRFAIESIRWISHKTDSSVSSRGIFSSIFSMKLFVVEVGYQFLIFSETDVSSYERESCGNLQPVEWEFIFGNYPGQVITKAFRIGRCRVS